MIVIFTGPTLSPDEGGALLSATFRPPVVCGELYREALKRPKAIGIIDGCFQSIAAVWHKEILWALSQGIPVFGSASMGALRAAELASFGMIGHGRIFEAYRDGLLEEDDEVAVTHGPAELNYPVLSEAMVNMRFSLTTAEREGVIGSATRGSLLDIGKTLFYPERTYRRILDLGAAQGLPNGEIEALRHWLPQGAINQKREDALGMLRAMAALPEIGAPARRPPFRFEATDMWHNLAKEFGNA